MIRAKQVYIQGRLEPFSITVEDGEIVAILGADGAGKTTVLDALSGVCDIDGGERIQTHGAYMTEKSPLFADMTLRANLKFVCDLEGLNHARADERIRAAAALTDIVPYLDKPAASLALPIQRRCALALALLFEETNLYLDEPTRDLESGDALRLRRTLRQLRADKAILLCTRSVTEAERLADRIYLLQDGKLIAQCEPGRLDGLAADLHTMRARIRATEEEALSAGAQRVEKSPVAGCVDAFFACDDGESLLRRLMDQQLRVVEFSPAPLDVDDMICNLDTDAFPGEAEE